MLNFPEKFITGKDVKIRFKNRVHHTIFSVLEVKRSKIKSKQKVLVLSRFLISFL